MAPSPFNVGPVAVPNPVAAVTDKVADATATVAAVATQAVEQGKNAVNDVASTVQDQITDVS